LLENAAPLLESLNLPALQQGLWSMTRSICDHAEARLRQSSPKIRPEIHRAMAYIQAHLAENIQREQLGKLVNYDAVYLVKLFKEEIGMTFTDYMTLARMLLAQELLCETDIPIRDIVARCGYTDFSYFSARFKKICGMTPHEWRENNREAFA
jgi:two-component system response regulator YesN